MALWRLPRPDFHRLAYSAFQGTQSTVYASSRSVKAIVLFIVLIPTQRATGYINRFSFSSYSTQGFFINFSHHFEVTTQNTQAIYLGFLSRVNPTYSLRMIITPTAETLNALLSKSPALPIIELINPTLKNVFNLPHDLARPITCQGISCQK